MPKIPEFRGMELTTPYAEMSVAPEDYLNASVLILGRGNAVRSTLIAAVAIALPLPFD